MREEKTNAQEKKNKLQDNTHTLSPYPHPDMN